MKFSKLAIKYITAFIVSLALFMDALDTSIINTAIPAMSRSLQVNPIDLKIALISYLLSLAIFIPISGWVADKFGVKKVFISALFIFTLSSLWCGSAQSLTELALARSVQGLGGALMLPVGRLILLRTFDRHELVSAMNHVVMVVSVGLMLGPLAGGFITDHISWPWIFWVNIPVGIFNIMLCLLLLKDNHPKKPRALDFIGFVLFGGSLSALTFALSDLSESHTNVLINLLIISIALFMLVEYFFHSQRVPHPIVKMDLFKLRTFKISIFGNFCCRLGFGGVPFLLPLLFQLCLHFSAQLSGFLIVPVALGILFVKSVSLPLLRYFGYKKLLLANTVFISLSLWSFILISPGTPISLIALLTFIFGVLISLQYSGMNSLAYADITNDDLSSTTGIIGTTQQLSQSFGVAIGALLLGFYASSTTYLTAPAFHQTFLTLGFLTLFSIFVFLRLKPRDGHQMLSSVPPLKYQN